MTQNIRSVSTNFESVQAKILIRKCLTCTDNYLYVFNAEINIGNIFR
jgi:hypothetical protein